MENRDKVFAQNWIEQMRRDFAAHPFAGYGGHPLTYVFADSPYTVVNCFWWLGPMGLYWKRREHTLEEEVFAR